jgi:hypothetical protein
MIVVMTERRKEYDDTTTCASIRSTNYIIVDRSIVSWDGNLGLSVKFLE